jgi:hypothetical protein
MGFRLPVGVSSDTSASRWTTRDLMRPSLKQLKKGTLPEGPFVVNLETYACHAEAVRHIARDLGIEPLFLFHNFSTFRIVFRTSVWQRDPGSSRKMSTVLDSSRLITQESKITRERILIRCITGTCAFAATMSFSSPSRIDVSRITPAMDHRSGLREMAPWSTKLASISDQVSSVLLYFDEFLCIEPVC